MNKTVSCMLSLLRRLWRPVVELGDALVADAQLGGDLLEGHALST